MAAALVFVLTLIGRYAVSVAASDRAPARVLFRVALGTLGGVMGLGVFGSLGFLLGILGGAGLPTVVLTLRQQRRIRTCRRQFPDALTLIASGLRAGLSPVQALGIAAREIPAPLGEELKRNARLVQVGTGFAHSLEMAADTCQLRDAALALASVGFQMGIGGNLAELMDRIALDLRDREAFAGKMTAGTAQGRLTGVIVAMLPFGLGFLMNALAPDYLGPLFKAPAGRVMLLIAAVLNGIGLVMINKISRVVM